MRKSNYTYIQCVKATDNIKKKDVFRVKDTNDTCYIIQGVKKRQALSKR